MEFSLENTAAVISDDIRNRSPQIFYSCFFYIMDHKFNKILKHLLLFLVGYYNFLTGQATCAICPLRFYCDPWETGNITGIINPSMCPVGHYCPVGTEYSTQYPCLPGTYGDIILLGAASK